MSTPTRDRCVAFTVLFVHRTESFLEDFHTERARALELKYAKAAYVQVNGETAVMTKLVPFHGRAITRTIEGLPQEPDTLLNALVSSIDDRFSAAAEEKEQHSYQERLHA